MNDHDKPESPDEIALSYAQDAQRQALDCQSDWYAFRVEGHLAPCWSEWLDGLTIANLDNGETRLTGPVVDQAALHGLLVKLRDLNLPLISVNRIERVSITSGEPGNDQAVAEHSVHGRVVSARKPNTTAEPGSATLEDAVLHLINGANRQFVLQLKGWCFMNTLISTKNRKLSYASVAVWFLAYVVLTWLLAVGQASFAFDSIWIAVLVLIPCIVILMRLVRNPIADEPAGRKTHKGKLFGLMAVVVIALLLLQAVVGKSVLFLLPPVAAVILWLLKPQLDKQEWLYATLLALIAGVSGLGAEWISFITAVQWGLLQVPLTLLSFLAGWSILRRFGLLQQGIGRSRFLTAGMWPAVQSFLFGILLGTPWALASVVMGSAEGGRSAWVESWWQPLIALQPGIAEEAWGRVLMVPLGFLLFRRVSPNRTAFSTALIVMAFWFAYLHTSGNIVSALVSTLIGGSLLILPISIVCLYYDLETAIGFHFWMDFLKFAFALILFNH